MLKTYKILLVEDDLMHAMLVKQLLNQCDEFIFKVHHATYLAGALSLLSKENFDIILLDLNLPDSQGTDTIEKILIAHNTIPIMSITGFDSSSSLAQYLNNGLQDYLAKKDLLHTKLSARIQFTIQRKQNEMTLASPLKTSSLLQRSEPTYMQPHKIDNSSNWLKA